MPACTLSCVVVYTVFGSYNKYHQGLIEPSGKRACNCQYRNVDGEMLSVTINRYPYNYVHVSDLAALTILNVYGRDLIIISG